MSDDLEFVMPSVDVCAYCGDCYCDGIGCIADLDLESDPHAAEEVQQLILHGRAWDMLTKLLAASYAPDSALRLVNAELARAENRL